MANLLKNIPTTALAILVTSVGCVSTDGVQATLDALASDANQAMMGPSTDANTKDPKSSSEIGSTAPSPSAKLDGRDVPLAYAIWQPTTGSYVTYFNISDDPNRCDYLKKQPGDQPEQSNVLAFYLFAQTKEKGFVRPDQPGTYIPITDQTSHTGNGLYFGIFSWRKPGDDPDLLPSSRYSETGEIVIKSWDPANLGPAQGQVSIELSKGAGHVDIPFTAVFCDGVRGTKDRR